MRDRIPTQVLENGAIRVEQFDENGNSLGYTWIKRADEPLENGTPYSVNSVLTDETAQSIGLDVTENPTPNQAFAKLAERLVGLDGARAIIDALERNTIFPHQGFIASGAFTAYKTGRYRITAVGAGGTGGEHNYNDTNNREYTGGGGGAGGVGTVIIELQAGEQINFSISSGNATVEGIMISHAGENGKDARGTTIASGGKGGSVSVLSAEYSVNVYNGGNGENGKNNGNTPAHLTDSAHGGDISYDFAGQLVVNQSHNGLGIFNRYNLGYGGRGGYGAANSTTAGAIGGSAGIIIEYLGE